MAGAYARARPAPGVGVFSVSTSGRAQSTSGVNDAELNGNYVFTFVGFTGSGGSFSVFAAVGRFTADGAGNVTSGVLDSNGVSAASVLTAQPFTGTYMIGADNRGTLTLSVAGGTATFAFAMMANGNAELIRFEAAGEQERLARGPSRRPTALRSVSRKLRAIMPSDWRVWTPRAAA